jgi:hypothetical protein
MWFIEALRARPLAAHALARACKVHKKRRVESVTRLPTKRMATACWAFIVAKATSLEPAPSLDISPLRGTNMKIHQQLIHKRLWMGWGQFQVPRLCPPGAGKDSVFGADYMRHRYQ